MLIEVLLVPTIEGLAAEMRRDGHAAAFHFALLYGNVDLAAAGITEDGIDLDPKGVFENFRDQIVRAGGAGGAAFSRLGELSHVLDRFEGRVGAGVENDVALLRRADEIALGDVETNFFPSR